MQLSGVAGVFDRAAPTYDQVGVDLFGPVAEALVDELAPQPGDLAAEAGGVPAEAVALVFLRPLLLAHVAAAFCGRALLGGGRRGGEQAREEERATHHPAGRPGPVRPGAPPKRSPSNTCATGTMRTAPGAIARG